MSTVKTPTVLARSNRSLADRFGEAKARAQEAEALAEALRQEIIATGKAKLIGDDFIVTVRKQDVARLSLTEAKKILTPAQLAKCTKTTPTDYVRAVKKKD